MLLRPHAEDAHDPLRLLSQGIVNRFGKGRMVIRCIVVDEQDLIIGIGHNLSDGVEADRCTFVKIVAMAVIAAVDDNGEHLTLALMAR